MNAGDCEFLRECAALFRMTDPERARRLDEIADRCAEIAEAEKERLGYMGYCDK